ncbi:MAG: M24 family metallopeptidase [Candidatus Pacebacteria bacterium]|nr:M24 family metallopeptidase [Candidatus Paceibacterota bacterium]
MKSAVEATSEGHIEMMRKCKPGMREAHLMGFLRDQGLIGYNVKFKAYPDIVASGKNASVLHYETNNRVIQPKELVLCDCAHRVCGYCADITTTFPSDGKFTDKQRYGAFVISR